VFDEVRAEDVGERSILLQDAGPKQEPDILRQKVVLVVLGRVG
jgi:hypothetical protein